MPAWIQKANQTRPTTRRCAHCGNPFQPRNSKHRFDSPACRKAAARGDTAVIHGPQRAALERQVDAMDLGDERAAVVEACRALADQLDAESRFNDKAWREYRLALRSLMVEATDDGGSDQFGAFIAGLRAKVDDPEDTVS